MLDTNVIISALIWGGTPALLLEAAADGRIDLVTSQTLLTELSEVLNRQHLKARLENVAGSVEQAVALYAALTVQVTPATIPRAVPHDPDDDQVIAAALAGEAALIASGDRHLLSLRAYQTIRILNPANAVAAIGT